MRVQEEEFATAEESAEVPYFPPDEGEEPESAPEAQAAEEPIEERTLEDAEEILAKEDTIYQYVPTPEWGRGTRLKVRSLRIKEKTWVENKYRDENGEIAKLDDYRETLVALAAVKENGQRVFTPQHLKRLAEKNGKPIGRAAGVINRLSYDIVTDEDKAREKREQAGKNSSRSPQSMP